MDSNELWAWIDTNWDGLEALGWKSASQAHRKYISEQEALEADRKVIDRRRGQAVGTRTARNTLSDENRAWETVKAKVQDYYQRGYALEDIQDIVTAPGGETIAWTSLCKIAYSKPTPLDAWLSRA